MSKKSLLRRTLGNWSDLKRGTAVGSSIRQKGMRKVTGGKVDKAGQWLQSRSGEKGEQWLAQRIRRFQRLHFIATLLIVAFWVTLAAVSGVPLYGLLLGLLGILLVSWRMYSWVLKQVKKGGAEG